MITWGVYVRLTIVDFPLGADVTAHDDVALSTVRRFTNDRSL